jgi:hypothetical protein
MQSKFTPLNPVDPGSIINPTVIAVEGKPSVPHPRDAPSAA